MREAIGVTLSVICSNLRLNAHFVNRSSEKVDDSGSLIVGFPQEDWAKLLTDGISVLAMSILNTNNFDSMDITGEFSLENGSTSKEVKDDVRRMETVLAFSFEFKFTYKINLIQ